MVSILFFIDNSKLSVRNRLEATYNLLD